MSSLRRIFGFKEFIDKKQVLEEDKKRFEDPSVSLQTIHLIAEEKMARVWAVIAHKTVRFYLDNGRNFSLEETIERSEFSDSLDNSMERHIKLGRNKNSGGIYFDNKSAIPFDISVIGSLEALWKDFQPK